MNQAVFPHCACLLVLRKLVTKYGKSMFRYQPNCNLIFLLPLHPVFAQLQVFSSAEQDVAADKEGEY